MHCRELSIETKGLSVHERLAPSFVIHSFHEPVHGLVGPMKALCGMHKRCWGEIQHPRWKIRQRKSTHKDDCLTIAEKRRECILVHHQPMMSTTAPIALRYRWHFLEACTSFCTLEQAKEASWSIGGPRAANGSLETKNNASGGPRISARDRKEPSRWILTTLPCGNKNASLHFSDSPQGSLGQHFDPLKTWARTLGSLATRLLVQESRQPYQEYYPT